jgi:hypothetical protein
MGNKTSV